MTVSRAILLLLTLSFVACASHEGVYEPACIAYEGDRLSLVAGRFEWQRFTDERIVNEAGEAVAPFPGFPKSGTYKVADGRLQLTADDNVRLDDWFTIDHAGQRYLLDAKQHNAFLADGDLPDCVLKLAPLRAR